ncbi:HNH endonuclease [bacterium]|nr:HNH endonuclease [bacterium]
MHASERDQRVRLAAFEFLKQHTQVHGEILPRGILAQGFTFQGERVPLISPQGIFTPRILELPLTFCTVPPSLRNPPPYADEIGAGGTIRYRYRGTDPRHRDNAGLRRAMKEGIPLIYLYGIVPGQYRPVWPAYIVSDDPRHLTFDIAVDDPAVLPTGELMIRESVSDERRRYVTTVTQRRLHQAGFRLRVLRAYRERCAICVLRHPELLEAAHILPDTHPLGQPIIPNGLALCKLHHAAFDTNLLGIRPDYTVTIRRDILREHDGPMLRHGLQGIDGQTLHVPRATDYQPRRDLLEVRFVEFEGGPTPGPEVP